MLHCPGTCLHGVLVANAVVLAYVERRLDLTHGMLSLSSCMTYALQITQISSSVDVHIPN